MARSQDEFGEAKGAHLRIGNAQLTSILWKAFG
jgi:hypothetical protein